MEEIRIDIYGRVQGVNFRSIVKNYADNNGVKGYIVNRSDGSILVVAQSSRQVLEEFLQWISSSPGFSKVKDMKVGWYNTEEIFSEFRIQRAGSYVQDKAAGVFRLVKSFSGSNNSLNDKKMGVVPEHIVLIPDGNRRWALLRGLDVRAGHHAASDYERLKELFYAARNMGVKYFTLWAFSTENWKRDKKEITMIFDRVLQGVTSFLRDVEVEKTRFIHIGRKDRLPEELAKALEELEKASTSYKEFTIVLAIDYGGRDEIERAVNEIVKKRILKIDDPTFREFLDTKNIPDPDLIIRTGGERRISGFMVYQTAYSEFYFTDVFFPDFDIDELRKAIMEYGKRSRRFGGN
ncbi:MAG: polyprenyl diphosphate synthase [Nanoarchaeota archaeon]|nr:polyprenyl diphosphate synthase [Nanoarchaeota archaeon]